MVSLPEAALGAIVAATITGLVSLLGLIISKENKTSEFREAWISALRSELATLMAHLNALQGLKAFGDKDKFETFKLGQPDALGANKAIMAIRLRLNSSEVQAQNVLGVLERYEKIFRDKAPEPEELATLHGQLVPAARALLKTEWDRVRHGEIVFQAARAISFAALIGGLTALVFAWIAK